MRRKISWNILRQLRMIKLRIILLEELIKVWILDDNN